LMIDTFSHLVKDDTFSLPCGRLSWLPVSFLLHVKYTLSCGIVAYFDTIPACGGRTDRRTNRQTSCDAIVSAMDSIAR